MSKRAIGGIRVSTRLQATRGYSLDDQERDLRRHCEQHGYELVEVIRDEGESGTLKHRPGLLRMIERAKSGAADVVVYPKIDRLGRDALIILQTLEFIRSQGIPVEYADHQIDVSTPAGKFHEVVMAGVAGLELAMIRDRMLAGREAKAASGRPPLTLRGLGYRSVSVAMARALPEYAGRDGEIEIIESEAAIVRELYRRYASGEVSQRALTRDLNQRGIPTKRGGLWSQTTVREILSHPIYRGELRWPAFRVQSVEEADGTKRRVFTPVPASEQYVYEVPAIVEPALWYQVQERLAENLETKVGRPPRRSYLLTGMVFCDVCRTRKGTALRCSGGTTGKDRRGYEYTNYFCSSYGRTETTWCGAKIRTDRLEAQVYAFVLASLEPGKLGELARVRAESSRETIRVAGETLDALRKALREAVQQEERCADLILANISPAIVASRVQEVQARQAALRMEIARLERETGAWMPPDLAARQAEQQAAHWRAELLAAKDDPARLKEVYAACVRVFIHPTRKPRCELLL